MENVMTADDNEMRNEKLIENKEKTEKSSSFLSKSLPKQIFH